MSVPDAWEVLTTPPPEAVSASGLTWRIGQRVRVVPRPGGDAIDIVLAGRAASIRSIDVTTEGEPYFGVTIDDDPGKDLGDARFLGHRFFFRAGDLAPLGTRVLVAGIGNILFGDDGFGVAVAQRLAAMPAAAGVTVADFGIRGLALAYALQDEYDLAILVDAMPHGGAPGTICVVEPEIGAGGQAQSTPDAHTLDPVRVLALASALGRVPRRVVVVGCEPASVEMSEGLDATLFALSPEVAAAVGEAERVVRSLIEECTSSFTS